MAVQDATRGNEKELADVAVEAVGEDEEVLRKRKQRSMRAEVARRRAALKQQEAERRLPLQFGLIILNSLGSALVLSMISALIIRNLDRQNPFADPEITGLLLFMTFAIGFLLTLLLLMRRLPPNWWQLANEFVATGKYEAPSEKWGGVLSKPNAEFAPLFDITQPKKVDAKNLPKTLSDNPDEGDFDAPKPVSAPPPEGDAPGEDAAVAETVVASVAPEESTAEAKAQAESEIDTFVAGATAAVQAAGQALDTVTRFATQLYLAGACSAAAKKFVLSAKDAFGLIVRVLAQTGTGKMMAESFATNVEEYGQRPAYRQVIDAGCAAMDAHLDGQPEAAASLTTTLVQWSAPEYKSRVPRIVTFMFTDIVDAAALKDRLGNLHAQRVLRAHDETVRDAIAKNKGTELRHTGDGIMATFPDPAKALAAAQAIQQKLDEHNKKQPHLSANVRIALNAGEAVKESEGFFGAAVKMTAEVCAMAKAGQILASDVIKAFCKSSAHAFAPCGDLKIAALDKSRPVFEVSWLRAGAGLDYADIGRAPAA
ncbi:MAG: adenylate/guanylate cyclase domain-containing protein [Rhodospirillaceae bacterium]|nr:adenylate/guanylate cyclase domain-containing protein [Rhodospirillaceae bacterium]